MDIVSYLTINNETREIADERSREDIRLLQTQVEYIATVLDIDISEISVPVEEEN